ncbi:MAG: hypothetical protein KAX80_05840, partial [Planctomycetes bacterium]|nr:hypothetical protein [Planctomycetota bacterium]
MVFEGFGTPDESQRIILFEWDFDGDGEYDWNSTKTGRATYRFWDVGLYNATFRVTQYNVNDQELVTANDTTTVSIISGKPVGRITSSSTALVDSDHRLEADYYDPDGGQLEYEWRIDGSLVSNEASFKYKFKEIRTFNVTLFVTDDEDEWATQQTNVRAVEELDEESDNSIYVYAIVTVLAILAMAVLAYRSILTGHKEGKGKKDPMTYAELDGGSPEIVTEASLADREAEAAPRSKPKVVRPERMVVSPEKAKSRGLRVAAAPDRMPCPECGTIISEDGSCAFCGSNEAIDNVEKHLRDLQGEGYILAKAEEELERAKTELHVKSFEEVDAYLSNAREMMEVAVREHEKCLGLMALNDELIIMAKDLDLDVTKASNLLKLSKSFLKSGKYEKAVYYAERSRDYLLDTLEPFDLDLYFCEHCKGEVGETDDECPHCEKAIESGILKRAKRELADLKRRFGGLSKGHEKHQPIAAQLEKATEHVDNRSTSAANEHIGKARGMMDETDQGDGPDGKRETSQEEDKEAEEV